MHFGSHKKYSKGSWDDVIRKTEPVEKEKKELPELNFEKSKEGLAAEYEQMVSYFLQRCNCKYLTPYLSSLWKRLPRRLRMS